MVTMNAYFAFQRFFNEARVGEGSTTEKNNNYNPMLYHKRMNG